MLPTVADCTGPLVDVGLRGDVMLLWDWSSPLGQVPVLPVRGDSMLVGINSLASAVSENV